MFQRAGAGSDVIAKYSATEQAYKFLGIHLAGVGNNPYVNGISYCLQRLHISWTYRKFFEYEGSNSQDSTAHKAQAGPNGPENNYDLNYAYSDDQGQTWMNSKGQKIGCLQHGNLEDRPILPSSRGIKVFDIPMNSGILNQEGQCADFDGGFHVLNRERIDGRMKWIVYSRNRSGTFPSSNYMSNTDLHRRSMVKDGH
jgi:hypothetical protein